MKIYFHELSEEPKRLTFSGNENWVKEATVEASETEEPPSKVQTGGDISFELRRSQDMILLKGVVNNLKVELLCSRCATPFSYSIKGSFQGIYSRTKEHVEKSGNVGVAYSEPTGGTEEDLEIEFLEKDYLELSDVLKEQIYLKIPFQPLCSQDCRGICPTCGQNQNSDPCQCRRIRESPLAKALAKSKIRVGS